MEKKHNILEKAFLIFECLGEENEAISLDDVSKKTGLSKSTSFRILNQLVDMHYIDKFKNAYQMSMKFFSLAKTVFHNKRDIQEIVQRYMIELRDTYNETVNFAIWDNKHAIFFACQPSRHVFRIENKIGQTLPLHSMAIGKSIAAYLPRETVKEVLERDGMLKKTKNTITNLKDYFKEIQRIKKRGYAADNEECYEGVRCVAVPVFSSGNVIFGGLSISGPATRITHERILQMQKDLQISAYHISFELSSFNIESGKSLRMNNTNIKDRLDSI